MLQAVLCLDCGDSADSNYNNWFSVGKTFIMAIIQYMEQQSHDTITGHIDLHAHKRMRSQKEQIFPAYLTMQILRYHGDK